MVAGLCEEGKDPYTVKFTHIREIWELLFNFSIFFRIYCEFRFALLICD